MAKRRAKSLQQIIMQAQRIQDRLHAEARDNAMFLGFGVDPNSEAGQNARRTISTSHKRFDRVEQIRRRYEANIKNSKQWATDSASRGSNYVPPSTRQYSRRAYMGLANG